MKKHSESGTVKTKYAGYKKSDDFYKLDEIMFTP